MLTLANMGSYTLTEFLLGYMHSQTGLHVHTYAKKFLAKFFNLHTSVYENSYVRIYF